MLLIRTLVCASLPLLVLALGDGGYNPMTPEGIARLQDLKSKACARNKAARKHRSESPSVSGVATPAMAAAAYPTLAPENPSTDSPSPAYDSQSPQVVEAAKIKPSPSSPAADSSPATYDAPAPSPSPASGGDGGGNGGKGAFGDSSVHGGPNGAEDFFNQGISSSDHDSGWNPPYLKLADLKTISLSAALALPNSPFAACAPYASLFQQHGDARGIAPIILASIAMQESSCNAGARGDNGGAFGLMQITQDKCESGDCSEPGFNIGKGAAVFANNLSRHDGNVLLALGSYNGWSKGMSFKSANAIRGQCCQCVNNLDYLQSFLNGWILGIDGSTLGKYRNAIC